MFIVINKSKVFSYILSLFIIFILFFTSANINKNNLNNTALTSSKPQEFKEYKMKVFDDKIQIIVDEKCSKDEIESILKTLNDKKTEITFLSNE